MLQPINDSNFHNEVREKTEPTVIYFTGTWCKPCKNFKPIIEKTSERMNGDIRFLIADMEENEKTARELNIRTLPSLALFVDGMIRHVHSGSMKSEELRLWIQENL